MPAFTPYFNMLQDVTELVPDMQFYLTGGAYF